MCGYQCDNKQLLDEVFVISGIIKVEVSVISRSRRLRFPRINCRLLANEKTDGDYNV